MAASEPLISVIVPTYNRADTIRQALQSVVDQTHDNFEVFVADDGSTDNTEDVVRSFNDPRIHYLRLEHTGRPAVARNEALRKSKGSFIAFLDSDDIWYPEKTARQLAVFEKYPDLLAVATTVMWFDGTSEWREDRLWSDWRVRMVDVMKNNMIVYSSTLMRASLIQQIGLTSEALEVNASEDFEYWLRLLDYKDRSILIMKDVLTKYRTHKGSHVFVLSKKTLPEEERYAFCLNMYKHKYPELVRDYIAAYKQRMNIVRATIAVYHGVKNPSEILSDNVLPFLNRLVICAKYYTKKILGKLPEPAR